MHAIIKTGQLLCDGVPYFKNICMLNVKYLHVGSGNTFKSRAINYNQLRSNQYLVMGKTIVPLTTLCGKLSTYGVI